MPNYPWTMVVCVAVWLNAKRVLHWPGILEMMRERLGSCLCLLSYAINGMASISAQLRSFSAAEHFFYFYFILYYNSERVAEHLRCEQQLCWMTSQNKWKCAVCAESEMDKKLARSELSRRIRMDFQKLLKKESVEIVNQINHRLIYLNQSFRELLE